MEDFTIFQEMKDIVKRSMSQIKYEFHFFFSDLPMSIWTRNMLLKEMWLLCGKETITWKNDEFVKPFLAPKAYGDTETQQLENKKKTHKKQCIYHCVHRELLRHIKILQNIWYVL